MDTLHNRLREELDRCGLSAAKAAKMMGEPSSQGLRDVLGGRKRLSAEMLAVIAAHTPIDPMYILLGQRSLSASKYGIIETPDEAEMLAEYREGSEEARDIARYTLKRATSKDRKAV